MHEHDQLPTWRSLPGHLIGAGLRFSLPGVRKGIAWADLDLIWVGTLLLTGGIALGLGLCPVLSG
jgi:hypothetical protein